MTHDQTPPLVHAHEMHALSELRCRYSAHALATLLLVVGVAAVALSEYRLAQQTHAQEHLSALAQTRYTDSDAYHAPMDAADDLPRTPALASFFAASPIASTSADLEASAEPLALSDTQPDAQLQLSREETLADKGALMRAHHSQQVRDSYSVATAAQDARPQESTVASPSEAHSVTHGAHPSAAEAPAYTHASHAAQTGLKDAEHSVADDTHALAAPSSSSSSPSLRLHHRIPLGQPAVEPSPSYRHEIITPLLQRYLQWHSWHTLEFEPSALLCARQWLLTPCCAANYGSTFFRFTAALKLAMMSNRTLVVTQQPDPNLFRYYLDFRLATLDQMKELFHHRQCERPFTEHTWRPHADVEEIHFEKNFHNGSSFGKFGQTPWLYDEDDSTACEDYEPAAMDADGDAAAAADPQPVSITKRGESFAVNIFYYQLRCATLAWLLRVPILKVFIGDDFHFLGLLVRNAYYRRASRLHALLPPALWDVHLAPYLFDFFIQPSSSMRRIVQEVSQGLFFDYYVHLRGTIKEEEKEFDRRPAVRMLVDEVLVPRLLRASNTTAAVDDAAASQNESLDGDLSQRLIFDLAAFRANFSDNPLSELRTGGSGQAEAPAAASADDHDRTPSTIRIFLSSAYSPPEAVCSDIITRLAEQLRDVQRSPPLAAPRLPPLLCRWFNSSAHASLFGLNPNYVIAEQSSHDWGLSPPWTALVNLFMASAMRPDLPSAKSPDSLAAAACSSGEIFTLTYSRYGAMLGVVAHRRVSGHVEQVRNVEAAASMWPF